MNTANPIMLRTMRRVYCAWAYRIVTHPTVIKLGLFLYACGRLSTYVSYRSVLHNVPGYSLEKSGPYLRDAFLHTEMPTQTLIILALIVAPFLMYDAVRNLSLYLRHRLPVFPTRSFQ